MSKRNIWISAFALAVVLICGTVLYAQMNPPVVNIDPHRHGNMAAAQSSIVEAYQRLNRAERENDDQLGGHAQKAKEFLVQADEEIRLAANVANRNRQ